MRLGLCFRVLGLLLMLVSTTMLWPLAISLFTRDHNAPGFISALSITFAVGLLMWLPVRR